MESLEPMSRKLGTYVFRADEKAGVLKTPASDTKSVGVEI